MVNPTEENTLCEEICVAAEENCPLTDRDLVDPFKPLMTENNLPAQQSHVTSFTSHLLPLVSLMLFHEDGPDSSGEDLRSSFKGDFSLESNPGFE